MTGPSLLRRLRRRLRALVDRDRLREEHDEELRFHLDMEADHNVRLGYTPRSARAKARRELGDTGRWRRERGIPAGGRVDDAWRDVRLAARALRRSPAFTTLSVLTLALGIGVSTAVFSVVDGVLLRPLPYPAPHRLVRLHERTEVSDRGRWPGADFADVRAQATTLSHVAAWGGGDRTILGADEPVRGRVVGVSPGFFDVFGVRAARGRTPTPDEGRDGGAMAAVVSDRFWRTALGADPNVLARTLRIGNGDYPVVGVMPPAFDFPSRTDVWVAAVDENPSRTAHNWSLVGRLAPGATVAEAHAQVDAIMRRVRATYGENADAIGAQAVGLHADMARDVRRPLLVLGGAVSFLLLIACVNLASAGLARGETRQREFAVRTALGAARCRIVGQVLTESVVLAAVGGVLGMVVAFGLTRALVATAADVLPGFAAVRVDARVLAFTAAASILTGLLVGSAPAWKITRDLRGAISAGGKAGIDGSGGGARRALIGAEVALAVALLAGAGLLVRSLATLLSQELGFDAARVVTADVALAGPAYADTTSVARYYDRLLAAVRELPGVERAGVVDAAPFSGTGANSGFMLDGGEESVGDIDYRVVDSTYFRTLGIPLRQGRAFGPDDRSGAPHVVLINEAAARKYFPQGSPLGHRIRFPGMDQHAREWLTVVGVVGDARAAGLDEAVEPAAFIHYPQRPERLRWGATVVVKAREGAAGMADALRARVRAVDPNVPVRVSSLETFVAESVAQRRLLTTVLTTFATIALGLAALGIYGVLAYAVAQRQREIGVRMALGAQRGCVRGMVLRDAMVAVVPGALVGVAGALALTRLLRGMLFGVAPTDPVTFAAAVALLGGVALLASWVPARRATRVDPLTAIRAE